MHRLVDTVAGKATQHRTLFRLSHFYGEFHAPFVSGSCRHLKISCASLGATVDSTLDDAPIILPNGKTTAAPLKPQSKIRPEFIDMTTLIERLRNELPAVARTGDPINRAVKEKVTRMLQQAKLNPREWQQHAIFRRGRYTRNIVGYSPNQFIALLLCWEAGQQSPIHDHAGAHCFMKMLTGRLTEERFDRSEDGGVCMEVTQESHLDANTLEQSVAFIHDAVGLHRISNPSTTEVAVSLHVYSPPFTQCLIFPPTGGMPKVAPIVSAVLPGAASATGDIPDMYFSQSLCWFCTSLTGIVQNEAALKPEDVADLLAPVELQSLEWSMYCNPAYFSEFQCTMNLVHLDAKFSVVVACWSPGQGVPAHNVGRGRQAWIKVLSGNLSYESFAAGIFGREDVCQRELPEGSVSIREELPQMVHRFENVSNTEPAVSLHVFSPPVTQLCFHTNKGFEKRDIPMLLGQSGETSREHLGCLGGRRYLSFGQLAKLLDAEFARTDASESAITTILRKAVFDRDEWQTCLGGAFIGSQQVSPPGPQRVLLAQRRDYTLQLAFWGCEHDVGFAHEHLDRRSWTLILQGELEEKAGMDEHQPTRMAILKEESLSFVDGSQPFWRRCDSDVPCVSLHLYRPPLLHV